MNKSEAQNILDKELSHFRDMRYEELQNLMGFPKVTERKGPSGVSYTIEIEVFWDNPKKVGGDLRVIGSIDDGNFFSSLRPLSSDFIIGPDGTFIGE